MSEWTSVEEGFPEPMQIVIGFCELPGAGRENFVGEVRYSGKDFERDYNTYESCTMNITHWMPLPRPPKEYEITAKHECKNCEGTWKDEPVFYCPYCKSGSILTTINADKTAKPKKL